MRSSEKVAFAWPDGGQVDGAFAQALFDLSGARPGRLVGSLRSVGGLLSRSRNRLVAKFLETDVDWLLMVDSDEVLTVPVFDKLIGAAHAIDRPILSGLVFSITDDPGALVPRPTPTIFRADESGFHPILDYPRDQVIEIAACGTGALLVHRRVFETIRAGADEHEGRENCWFRDLPVAGDWLGEDLYFCRRARAAGFPIHAHTGAVLPHHKSYWVDDRQFEAGRALAAEVTAYADSR